MKNCYLLVNEVVEAVEKLSPDTNPLYQKMDDASNGRLFADIFKDIARFNATARVWYVYDGKVWKMDEGDMIVEGLSQMLYDSLFIYCGKANADEYFRKAVYALGRRNVRVNMLKDARNHNFITQDKLDSEGKWFNCQNCTIDLETFKAYEHDSAMLLSKIANVKYNPVAHSQDFEKFINEVMCNDKPKTEYLQRLFGYALTATRRDEEFYMLYGATTRNGKSTLLETICNMMGDYSMNMQPETLAQKKKDSRNASGDIARLHGCRLLHCSEPPKRMLLDVGLIKTLTGNDTITARQIYERDFDFIPVFKLFMNTNYLPIVTDDTVFASGRVKVITFDRHFKPEEQDKRLKERLSSEINLSGVLNWCLSGLRFYRENGLSVPEAVVNATNEYREKSDKVGTFVQECLEKKLNSAVTISSVYEVYQNWCRDNGYGVDAKGNFIADLKTKGLYSPSGTVDGKTARNVIKGYELVQDGFYSDTEMLSPFKD